ncbi:OprD family outer membrane porin [Rubellicoccus peritrichatus]|uniref:OprD family outer membrane porin n=1 Tax=Rubellicoccus peritrichatus TaxID=3080537 RepID=A0AAQ3L9R5_9BACT|nr:OprD family outer membrane porin [Puniceicoccus sp. CR14]WOO41960.1 OprD family outer membrane porin [Puniceicoccus sp. CR14]
MAIRRNIKWIVSIVIVYAITSFITYGVTTPSYLFDDITAPETADSFITPLNDFQEHRSILYQEAMDPSFFPYLEDAVEEYSQPFISDTELSLNVRSYYLNQQRTRIINPTSEAWAIGGELDYKSGYWKDFLAIGASVYTTQKAYAPDGRDGTLLLGRGQNGFSVLGTSYVEFKFDKVKARFYRQTIETPFVNRHDNRMIPNTFEAYVIGSRDLRPVSFIVGQITKMKTRNENHFITIAERLGITEDTNGITMAGARFHPNEDSRVGAINYYVWDAMNMVYSETAFAIDLPEPWTSSFNFQFMDQRSVGEALIGDFSGQEIGINFSLGYHSAILSLGFTRIYGDTIRSPFGGYPGYSSIIVDDFNRAGQETFILGFSYDFEDIGLDGLSFFTTYANSHTVGQIQPGVPEKSSEYDLTIDYRFPEDSILDNLWIRLRGAWVSGDNPAGAPTFQAINDYRIIINYTIPIL